jgi:hypothetical protein
MLQLPVTHGRRSHHERAIGHGLGHGFEFFRGGEHVRGADGRARFAKRRLIRIHHAQPPEAEIAHGARGRTEVQGIPRGHQDNAEPVEFCQGGQEAPILKHAGGWRCSLVTLVMGRATAIDRGFAASVTS